MNGMTNGMTLRLTVVLSVVLLTADVTTKTLISTPSWGWHERQDAGWKWGSVAIIVCACLVAFCRVGYVRVACAYLTAGVAGNLLDSLDGRVANPFVLPARNTLHAFNFADICIEAAMVITAPLVAFEVTRWLLHRRRAAAAVNLIDG